MGRDSQTSRAVDAAKLLTEGFQQPIEAGVPIAELRPHGALPSGPRNMRNFLCTQEARAARYEPGAGQAVIKSPWLLTRSIDKSPLAVKLMGRSTRLTAISRIPFPTFRPFGVRSPAPVKKVELAPAPQVPLPTFRPSS